MVLLVIGAALALIAVWMLVKSSPETLMILFKTSVITACALAVIYFIFSGRLNTLLVVLVAALPILIPIILRRRSGGSFTQKEHISASRKMSVKEAYDILGLKEGATKQQIIDAHRRLMKKIHPDQGGTDYLARQLNEAKELLLKKI